MVLSWRPSHGSLDGSPSGVMPGYTHRISAAALRSRDLVRISGRGGTWRTGVMMGARWIPLCVAVDGPADLRRMRILEALDVGVVE